jgi:hypothetical protein
MNDDLWLKELAQVNRDREAEERSRLDERWDRLSAGELSPEEEAELRALADTSEDARDAYEAFRPLGPDFQASVVQAIRKQGLAPQAGTPAPQPPAKLLPFRRSTSQTFRWAGWSAAAAVAAAALFFVVRGPASYPPLPVYTAELSRGDQQFRGGTETATGVPVFSPGSTLTLNVRPEQAVAGPVEAQAFAARGTELIPLARKLQVENGSVRMRGTLGQEIRLLPGDWRIWIVVGRPGKIPAEGDLQAELRAGRTRHEDWQAISKELRVENQTAP